MGASFHSLDHGCKGESEVVGGGEQRPGGPTTLMGPPNQPTNPTPSLSPEASNTNGASADNYQPPHATSSIKNPEILRQFSELCVAAKSSKL